MAKSITCNVCDNDVLKADSTKIPKMGRVCSSHTDIVQYYKDSLNIFITDVIHSNKDNVSSNLKEDVKVTLNNINDIDDDTVLEILNVIPDQITKDIKEVISKAVDEDMSNDVLVNGLGRHSNLEQKTPENIDSDINKIETKEINKMSEVNTIDSFDAIPVDFVTLPDILVEELKEINEEIDKQEVKEALEEAAKVVCSCDKCGLDFYTLVDLCPKCDPSEAVTEAMDSLRKIMKSKYWDVHKAYKFFTNHVHSNVAKDERGPTLSILKEAKNRMLGNH